MKERQYRFLLRVLVIIPVLFSCLMTVTATNSDQNADATGSDDIQNVSDPNNNWPGRVDGLRVTVIDGETGKKVGDCFDWASSNMLNWMDSNKSKKVFWFGKSKLEYINSGASLVPQAKLYEPLAPESSTLPTIVKTTAGGNIAAIRQFFKESGRNMEEIAERSGVDLDDLKDGKYDLFIEPTVIFIYDGSFYAVTATEAAMLDARQNGGVKAKLGSLTHSNLPLALFLQKPQFGLAAHDKSVGYFENGYIKETLGMGIISFEDFAPKKVVYPVDTEVITAVTVYAPENKDITLEDNAMVTFSGVPGLSNPVQSFVVEKSEFQLVWVKWRTPKEPTRLSFSVETSHGNLETVFFDVEIVEHEEMTPPNPNGQDRNDSFEISDVPEYEEVTEYSWSVWYCWSVPVTKPDPVTGVPTTTVNWEFDKINYSAKLNNVVGTISPAPQVPTAVGAGSTNAQMKSGYGVVTDIPVEVVTADSNQITGAQNLTAVFSEFGYKQFNRFLESDNRGNLISEWHFKENEYSHTNERVHFTPVWYPDGQQYVVAVEIRDIWTPMGELKGYVILNDIEIEQSVFDDWYIKNYKE